MIIRTNILEYIFVLTCHDNNLHLNDLSSYVHVRKLSILCLVSRTWQMYFAVVWYKLEKKQKNLMICLIAGGLAVSTVYTALPIIKLLNPAFEGLAYQSSWLAVCLVNIRMMAGQLGNITNIYFPTGPFYYYEVWASCICARARIIWDILNSIFCGVPLSAQCLSTILAELK